jgi:hypothetical protein
MTYKQGMKEGIKQLSSPQAPPPPPPAINRDLEHTNIMANPP